MSIAHMGKLQENIAALCKMAAKLFGWALSADPDMYDHGSRNASSPIRRQAPDAKYPDGMSAEQNSGCETSGSLAKVHKPYYVIPTACHSPRFAALQWCIRTPILLAFQIYLWKRTSKLRFFMFLSFPLFCHGFQRILLNLGLLWW